MEVLNCKVVARAGVTVPDESLLQDVLRANGFNGHVGIKVLFEHYGHVLSNGESEILAFVGVHAGSRNRLWSRRRLWWNHYIAHIPMAGGFLRREGMAEYRRLEKLKCKLASPNALDLIGCIANYANRSTDLERTALAPEAWWWLGKCEQGWLAIDTFFFLGIFYESLSDLLNEERGTELVAEE